MATEANNRLNAKKPKPAPIPRPERLAQITGSSRTYAPGMQTNRTKNERANKKFRTFFKNGQAFHEYQIKGKRVVVKGNNNPSRKLKPYGKG